MEKRAINRNALSSLWVCVVLCMAFADILSIYLPDTVSQLVEGRVEGVELSEDVMLIAAVFILIPIAMVGASQFLSPRLLKPVTMMAALVTALFVIGGGSLKPHYILFAGAELIALVSCVWLVWKRPQR